LRPLWNGASFGAIRGVPLLRLTALPQRLMDFTKRKRRGLQTPSRFAYCAPYGTGHHSAQYAEYRYCALPRYPKDSWTSQNVSDGGYKPRRASLCLTPPFIAPRHPTEPENTQALCGEGAMERTARQVTCHIPHECLSKPTEIRPQSAWLLHGN